MIALIAVAGDAAEVDAARDALTRATSGLAFFEGAQVEAWMAASGAAGAVWIRSVGVDQAEGSSWTSASRAAFVLGQPIRWTDTGADGIDVLDAERMASEDPTMLAGQLDGRGLVVMVGDGGSSGGGSSGGGGGPSGQRESAARGSGLGVGGDAAGIEVVGDPMHSYPLYSLVGGLSGRGSAGLGRASVWVTNFPGALRRSGPAASTLVPSRIASAVAYGSSFDAAPWLAGVRRVGGWSHEAPEPAGLRLHSAAPSLRELAATHGRGDIHPGQAGELLVEITRAMAVRRGADLIVPVSAGKDSRLILAAALRAELPIRTVTGGSVDSADFTVGRWLATESGVDHQRISDAQPTRTTHPLETIDLTSRVTAGVVTAGDAHFFPHGPSDIGGVWLSGQAGEIARAFYGRPLGPATPGVVMLKTMSRRPQRPLPLTLTAERRMAGEVWRRLRGLRRAGVSQAALGDIFYLTDRMGRHISGALLHFELGLDYASPLWSRRLLPFMWAGTGPQRQASTFHDEVTLALVAGQPERVRKAFTEAVRGTGGPKEEPVEPGGFADEALAKAQAHLRALTDALPASDPIWNHLSRPRTVGLAERPGAELDFIERQHVWRLATALHSWSA